MVYERQQNAFLRKIQFETDHMSSQTLFETTNKYDLKIFQSIQRWNPCILDIGWKSGVMKGGSNACHNIDHTNEIGCIVQMKSICKGSNHSAIFCSDTQYRWHKCANISYSICCRCVRHSIIFWSLSRSFLCLTIVRYKINRIIHYFFCSYLF